MQQRIEPSDSLDFFPTPLWATRALCEMLSPTGHQCVWEPACGEGHMSKVLHEYFGSVTSTDIHDYGYGDVYDFLSDKGQFKFDWIITNPPFKAAPDFIRMALKNATKGVAMLTRIAFLEGTKRYKELFSMTPPTIIIQFSERVPMLKARLVKESTTATAYCWLVWKLPLNTETTFKWFPPCRKILENPTDYDKPCPVDWELRDRNATHKLANELGQAGLLPEDYGR